MREWWEKLRSSLGGRRRLTADLREEIEAHIDLETEENVARGMPPEAARLAARRRFGSATLIGERAREAWGFPALETLLRDLRHGLRGIRRSPGFSLVVILTLALGIGANTAIFSVVNTVLLKPLPYPHSERLIWLGESTPSASGISVTWVNYLFWRKENRSFDDLAGFYLMHLTLTGRGEPLLTRGAQVTSSFCRLLGMRPVLGRLLDEADERAGAPATVLLSHGFWIEKLGGDPAIGGAALILDGKPYQVVGVAAPGPQFFGKPADYYLPLGRSRAGTVDRSQHGSMRVLGRLKPGLTLAAALGDLDHIMLRLAQADPGPESDHRVYGAFLAEHDTREIRSTLLILMGAVALVLLIACANVASLVLARSTTRIKEMAVRTAIGAGRRRLVRQLLTENLLLAALGGLSGILVAQGCLRTLVGMGPREVPRLADTTLDLPVLLFAGAISILTGLLVGLAPLWTAGRLDLVSALKDGFRSAARGGGEGGHPALRRALVVFEIALTLVLAFASGLLLRSLIAAQTRDPGFRPERLLALELVLPSSRYETPRAAHDFYDRLAQELRQLPGVAAVGAVHCPPSAGDCGDWFYSVLGRPAPAKGEVPIALFNYADPAYFRTLGIPLLSGRGFTDADRAEGPRVAIVNAVFARKWWPGEPAVGHQIKFGGPYLEGPVYEIVGVAGNVSQWGLDTQPELEVYLPFSRSTDRAAIMMIRAQRDPASLIPAVRRRVAALDPNLPVQSLRPFATWVAATLERRRFSTLLLTLFAALAMVLAGVGIYGLLTNWVSVREQSIAIRLALGAQRQAILGWVGAQALGLAMAGVALGAATSWAASHWLEGMVFGVSPRSPLTLTASILSVVALATLSALLPLLRATRLDPARKLHQA